MDLSAYKTIAIGGIPMKKLTLDGVQIWQRPPINWVRRSINTDGTIYNNGLGYKDGYRVRSGGAEVAVSAAQSCTGFIKVSPGDVIRFSGMLWFEENSSGDAINVSDSSFTNLGQFTMAQNSRYGVFLSTHSEYAASSVVEEVAGVWKWIVPSDATDFAYIRISAFDSSSSNQGANMIVTINEPIE